MANLFQQAGDLMKLRKQAMEMQKKLAQERVTIEENGIKVVMSGDQKVVEFEVGGVSSQDAINALNKAIKKSQEVAAKQMQSMAGLSDMLGQLSGK
ncbi:MAG: YbaB/EbfC family nucleoid-associated protein [Pseudomonadales bacterium]|jgi:DNA-binding protein YbaB|nr:YbaB/EbfC family nucleoid-associated protein [Pseudomonadales bacterium]